MNKFSIGIFSGIFSGISWGLNTVIIGVILSSTILTFNSKNLFTSTLVVAFLHDFISALWLSLNLIRTQKIKKLLVILKKRSIIFLICGSILGGPIGMASYLLGVKYIGPSYTACISSLYPVLGTLLTAIFFKEKINKNIKTGVFLCVIGIILLSYVPINFEIYPNYKLGILFSIICVLGWAAECVIAAYAMKYGEIDSDIAICIRQITSFIFYSLLIIPIIKGYGVVLFIVNTKLIIILILTSLIGSLSYLFWYKSIDTIGAPRGMCLNITYIIWTVLFEILFFKMNIDLRIIISSLVVFLGIVLVLKKK